MKYKITIILILVMFLFICSLSTISAANQTINSTSIGGISQGITDTGSEETLFLQPGTYNKTGQDTNININKNITIQGNGSIDSVIIDAQKLSRIFTIGNGYNVIFINLTFINGNFSNGGAIHNNYESTQLTLINYIISNNTQNTGAVYNRGDNLTVIDSIFSNNIGREVGGAIRNFGNGVTITNSTFINNTALLGNAGAVYLDFNSNGCIVSNSTFIDNYAHTDSGSLYIRGNNTIVYNCTFRNNNAGQGGAGMSVSSASLNCSIINCNFSNNSAHRGGAVYTNSNGTNIVDCIFDDNKANYGSAIFVDYRNNGSVVINNTFTNNIANIEGTIYNNGSMSVSGNTMGDNSAGLGQMIYNNGTMGILRLTYLDNSTVTTSKSSTITIYATLTDDMGNTVTGQDISFYINSVFIVSVISIEGKASTTYLVAEGPGSVLPVTGDYAGYGEHAIVIKNGELLIPKIPTKITVSVPEEVKVGETATIESKLTDKDGNPIANATIDFYVDGKKIGSAVTDANGVAKLDHTFDKAGKPTITAKYAGNNTYEPSNATDQTTVSKIKTNLELETDNEIITATLTDEDGNSLTNKKITITVNGKTFTGITDSNGQVIIKFPNANKYKVTAKFAGDDQYAPSSATVPGESEPNEPTSDVLASGKVTMKSTGIPIIVVLLALIASISLVLRKRD